MYFIIYLSVAVIFGTVSPYNVTTQTQNFFLRSQHQLQTDIYISELKINAVEQRGNDHVRSVTERNRAVLQHVKSSQQNLHTLQELSLNRRRCVQQYQGLLVKWQSVEQKFATCLYTTQSRVKSIAISAKNALNLAKNEVNTLLPKAVTTCNNTYARNETGLEECVFNIVDIHSKKIKTYLNLVENNLVNKDRCMLSDISRETILCSFEIEKSAMHSIGMVQGLVDKCLVEGRLCPCDGFESSSTNGWPTPGPAPVYAYGPAPGVVPAPAPGASPAPGYGPAPGT